MMRGHVRVINDYSPVVGGNSGNSGKIESYYNQ